MSDNTRRQTSQGWDDDRIREFVSLTDELRARLNGITGWWSQTGSNRRPPACKAGALPTELWPQVGSARLRRGFGGQPSQFEGWPANRNGHTPRRLVGLGRFELPTSRLSSARSNQLSYRPNLESAHSRPRIPKTAGKDVRHRPWE